jgi:hypothetical protein
VGVKAGEQHYTFLTPAINGEQWSTTWPDHYTPGKSTWYSQDRNFEGPQVSLNAVVKRNTSAPSTNPIPFLHFFSTQCSTLQKKLTCKNRNRKFH